MPTPTARLAIVVSVKVRFWNSESGMIGSSTLSSTRTASPSSTIAPPSISQEASEFHSNWLPPSVTQISSSDTPPAISAAPSRSILTRRECLGRWRVRWMRMMATIATGTAT